MIHVGILGANGRMGQSLIQMIPHIEGLCLSHAIVRDTHESLGNPVGLKNPTEMRYTHEKEEAFQNADVMVEFMLPEATVDNVSKAKRFHTPLVIGTTGLGEKEKQALSEAAKLIPIVYDTNMSFGIAMLNQLVEQVAHRLQSLDVDFDCEIHEKHHKYKKDIPSGTAITLGQHVARGRGVDLEKRGSLRSAEKQFHSLQTVHQRQPGEIGFSAQRGGGIFGDHDVSFVSDEEMLTLSHRALNRSVFAKGALIAAKWVVSQKPGLYTMADVLGL